MSHVEPTSQGAPVTNAYLSLWLGVVCVPTRQQTSHEIMAEIADFYGVTVADLKARDRVKLLAHARHHAMYEVRQRTNLSLPAIARRFDRGDHTTVLHGVRQHERRMAEASA